MKKIKIKIEKPKKRIPLPKKPPKVMDDGKVYDRGKMKKEMKNLFEDKLN